MHCMAQSSLGGYMARYSKKEEVDKITSTLKGHLSQEQAMKCYENAKKIPDGQRVPIAVNTEMVFVAKSRAIKIFGDIAGVE